MVFLSGAAVERGNPVNGHALLSDIRAAPLASVTAIRRWLGDLEINA